jgi:hypothetical protein
MNPVGFEPTISAGERPQTYVLDRAATATGVRILIYTYKQFCPAGAMDVVLLWVLCVVW